MGDIPAGVEFLPVFQSEANNNFNQPVLMEEIPGRAGHFLVGEVKTGNLYILIPHSGGYQKELYGTREVRVEGNMGFFGLAFHPNFIENRLYYIQYNPAGGARRVVIEERLAAAHFLSDSESHSRFILEIDLDPDFTGHQGGDLNFGRDGFLYASFGDGGWANYTPEGADIHGHGQNLGTLLAAIIRIDINTASEGLEYSIPGDNPFVGVAGARGEIWAYGLRNPWRWNFNPYTGEILLGDVGSDVAEEINLVRKGGNYGWKAAEGDACYAGACELSQYQPPLRAFSRTEASTIVGGFVFQGRPGSGFDSVYFCADHGTRKLYGLRYAADGLREFSEIGETPSQAASMARDLAGNLYLVGHSDGILYQLTHEELQVPAPVRATPEINGSHPAIFRNQGEWAAFWELRQSALEELRLWDVKGRLVRHYIQGLSGSPADPPLTRGVYLAAEIGGELSRVYPVFMQYE